MPVLVVPRAVMSRLTHDPDRFLGVRMSGDDPDCGLLTSFVAQAASRREIEHGSTTQATLADLAMEWGFYDLSHMTGCFREVYGLPPGNFAAHRRHVLA